MNQRSFPIAALLLAAAASVAPAETFTRVCLLRGIEEVPANASNGVGAGRFLIDTCTNTVTFRIVVGGLTSAETAAHIHGFVNPGVAAGVVLPLPLGTVKTGTWTYPEVQENDILSGRAYVNIHTVNFPGGEVRGQIVTHVASIDGVQETPTNGSPARGFGVFNLNANTNELTFYIAYNGLTAGETAAHIHGFSNFGTASGVIFPLPLGPVKTGIINFTEAQQQGLIDGMTYVNIHSGAFPGGEIRGQVISSVNPVDGQQENPPNPSNAAGYALIALDRAANTAGHDIARTAFGSAETATHFHGFAPAGMNAPVIQGLALGVRKLGLWVYGAANANAFINNEGVYFNDHTAAFGGGEIRGQIRFPLLVPPCVADTDDGSGTGTRDGGIGIEDLLYYLALYNAGTTSADVDDGNGNGCRDGGVGIEDLLYYLGRYNAGC